MEPLDPSPPVPTLNVEHELERYRAACDRQAKLRRVVADADARLTPRDLARADQLHAAARDLVERA